MPAHSAHGVSPCFLPASLSWFKSHGISSEFTRGKIFPGRPKQVQEATTRAISSPVFHSPGTKAAADPLFHEVLFSSGAASELILLLLFSWFDRNSARQNTNKETHKLTLGKITKRSRTNQRTLFQIFLDCLYHRLHSWPTGIKTPKNCKIL